MRARAYTHTHNNKIAHVRARAHAEQVKGERRRHSGGTEGGWGGRRERETRADMF